MTAVRWAMLIAMTAVTAAGTRCGDPDKPQPVRVTVVVVLASTHNNVVDPKLTALAKEMEKKKSDLVGFKLFGTIQKSIAVGGSYEFDLIEGQTLTVTVDKSKDKNERVSITLTTSGGGAVSYTCVCDKFFPLITEHKTKCGRTLLVAVGAKPCTGKGP
jgi:hypothetical protein